MHNAQWRGVVVAELVEATFGVRFDRLNDRRLSDRREESC